MSCPLVFDATTPLGSSMITFARFLRSCSSIHCRSTSIWMTLLVHVLQLPLTKRAANLCTISNYLMYFCANYWIQPYSIIGLTNVVQHCALIIFGQELMFLLKKALMLFAFFVTVLCDKLWLMLRPRYQAFLTSSNVFPCIVQFLHVSGFLMLATRRTITLVWIELHKPSGYPVLQIVKVFLE